MKLSSKLVQRPLAAVSALALAVGVSVPALLSLNVSAAEQMPSRSIQVSDSAPSGGTITSGVGSGTLVEYKISFMPSSTAAIGGIVIDVCGNNPIIGDTTCTSPSGFDWGATPTVTVDSGLSGTWTATASTGDSTTGNPILRLSSATPAAPTGSPTPIVITVTGVTNPDTANQVGTSYSYYARMMTFDTTENMDVAYPQALATSTRSGLSALDAGGLVDYGGVALSATTPISITAKVMETMSFCTSEADLTALACAGATAPNISIGEDFNGTKVLRDNITSTAKAYSQISTNAANGYDIYMRGHNSCPEGGLSKNGGTVCEIPAVAAGDAIGNNLPSGTAAFGAIIGSGTAVTGGTGTNTAVTKWAGPNYVMDTTTALDNVNLVYGSHIIESTVQANSVKNEYTFAATASPTTPAGIYTQHFSLIAAGRF